MSEYPAISLRDIPKDSVTVLFIDYNCDPDLEYTELYVTWEGTHALLPTDAKKFFEGLDQPYLWFVQGEIKELDVYLIKKVGLKDIITGEPHMLDWDDSLATYTGELR